MRLPGNRQPYFFGSSEEFVQLKVLKYIPSCNISTRYDHEGAVIDSLVLLDNSYR